MRTFVILGIILLVVSIGIAKLAIDHQTPAASAKNQPGKNADDGPERIACWGFFEVKGGIVQMDATQPGEVTFVEQEYKKVSKGDPLMKVNDRFAKLKVEQAEIAVEYAKLQLDEAKQLTKFYALQKEQQQAAIKGVKSVIAQEKLKEETALKTVGQSDPKYETIQNQYKEAFIQLDQKLAAEIARLKQLELQDAELKIAQADADWRAKQAQLKEAKEALSLYEITAKTDGSIQRANYRVGEIVTANPMKHALEFKPDAPMIVRAEVLQEWGRYILDPKQHPGIKQEVDIEDDTYNGSKWHGEIESVGGSYGPARSQVIEPFRFNDVRTLEIVIRVTDAKDVKMNQRVRAMVKKVK